MKRIKAFVVLSLFPLIAAAEGEASVSNAITVTLDPSLVTFIKYAIVVGGGFLAIFAAIGVIFFGYDVQKARAALDDTQKEIRTQLDGLRSRIADMETEATTHIAALKLKIDAAREMREDLEQLGAQLEEGLEENVQQPKGPRASDAGDANADGHAGQGERTKSDRDFENETGDTGTTQETRGTRSIQDLIREIIRSSKFEWTTIGRLLKRTDLSRDELMEIVRKMPDVQIGVGSRTRDTIFRLKNQR